MEGLLSTGPTPSFNEDDYFASEKGLCTHIMDNHEPGDVFPTFDKDWVSEQMQYTVGELPGSRMPMQRMQRKTKSQTYRMWMVTMGLMKTHSECGKA